MNPEDVFAILSDIRDEFNREEERAIRQHRMDKAIEALAGKDVLERIEFALRLRFDMRENVVRMARRAGK